VNDGVWQLLMEFELPSQAGNERRAMEQVSQALEGLGLSNLQTERLKTAVAEATMNAMEHGNRYQVEQLVGIRVFASPTAIKIQISDHGGGSEISAPETPDLEAKLEGLQSARGWGLFLIKNMVDEMNIISAPGAHTVELIVHL
jgi:anti-sigma regulatory factor (Ser/Thr protein kinase)